MKLKGRLFKFLILAIPIILISACNKGLDATPSGTPAEGDSASSDNQQVKGPEAAEKITLTGLNPMSVGVYTDTDDKEYLLIADYDSKKIYRAEIEPATGAVIGNPELLIGGGTTTPPLGVGIDSLNAKLDSISSMKQAFGAIWIEVSISEKSSLLKYSLDSGKIETIYSSSGRFIYDGSGADVGGGHYTGGIAPIELHGGGRAILISEDRKNAIRMVR